VFPRSPIFQSSTEDCHPVVIIISHDFAVVILASRIFSLQIELSAVLN
jgi:hypothetical protein